MKRAGVEVVLVEIRVSTNTITQQKWITAEGRRIGKQLYIDLLYAAVDVDTISTKTSGYITTTSKSIYIPKAGNKELLSKVRGV